MGGAGWWFLAGVEVRDSLMLLFVAAADLRLLSAESFRCTYLTQNSGFSGWAGWSHFTSKEVDSVSTVPKVCQLVSASDKT